MSQADAYRSAYNTSRMTDKTIHESASKLMADHKISTRVAELREKMSSKSIMTAQQRMEWLTELIGNANVGTTDRLRAIDIMNKMQGEYVQKVEANVQQEVTINVELVDDE
jgi:phage terminase small subunit